jgi:hypothetical protein
MPTNESQDVSRRLTLVQQIDDKRAADDPFKLPAQLRHDVDADAAALSASDVSTGSAEGDRAAASASQRRALDELERQLRGGYRFIAGLDEDGITDAQRVKVFETYGWKSGQIGRFDDARVVSLAETALKVGAGEIADAAWRYPQARLDRIKLQLDLVKANAPTASGGDRLDATKQRDAALDTAGTTLSRVRFYYCSASRDADRTPELAKIEFQPRRDYGTAGSGGSGGNKPAPEPTPASSATTAETTAKT